MTIREHVEIGTSLPMTKPTSGATAFSSILFPSHLSHLRSWQEHEPSCLVDLNLDQVVAAIVDKRDEEILRPIFYSSYRNEEIIRYRQAVFRDMERGEVYSTFPAFCDAMRSVRANLDYAAKLFQASHRNTVFLRAADVYCKALLSLLQQLQKLDLASPGLSVCPRMMLMGRG